MSKRQTDESTSPTPKKQKNDIQDIDLKIKEESKEWLKYFNSIQQNIREPDSYNTIRKYMPNFEITPQHFKYLITILGSTKEVCSIFTQKYYGEFLWKLNDGIGKSINASVESLTLFIPTKNNELDAFLNSFCFPSGEKFTQFVIDSFETFAYILNFYVNILVNFKSLEIEDNVTDIKEFGRIHLIPFYYLMIEYYLPQYKNESIIPIMKKCISYIKNKYKYALIAWFLCYINTKKEGNEFINIIKQSTQIFEPTDFIEGLKYYLLPESFREKIDSCSSDKELTEIYINTLEKSDNFWLILGIIIDKNIINSNSFNLLTEENSFLLKFIVTMDFYCFGTFSICFFKKFLITENLNLIRSYKTALKPMIEIVFNHFYIQNARNNNYSDQFSWQPECLKLKIQPSQSNNQMLKRSYKELSGKFDQLSNVIIKKISNYEIRLYKFTGIKSIPNYRNEKRFIYNNVRLPEVWTINEFKEHVRVPEKEWKLDVYNLNLMNSDEFLNLILWDFKPYNFNSLNTIQILSKDKHKNPIRDYNNYSYKEFKKELMRDEILIPQPKIFEIEERRIPSIKLLKDYIAEMYAFKMEIIKNENNELITKMKSTIDTNNMIVKDQKFKLSLIVLYCILTNSKINRDRNYHNFSGVGRFLELQFKNDPKTKIRLIRWYFKYIYFFIYNLNIRNDDEIYQIILQSFQFKYIQNNIYTREVVPIHHLLRAISGELLSKQILPDLELLGKNEWGSTKHGQIFQSLSDSDSLTTNYIDGTVGKESYLLFLLLSILNLRSTNNNNNFEIYPFLFEMDCWFGSEFTRHLLEFPDIRDFIQGRYYRFLERQTQLPNFYKSPTHLNQIQILTITSKIREIINESPTDSNVRFTTNIRPITRNDESDDEIDENSGFILPINDEDDSEEEYDDSEDEIVDENDYNTGINYNSSDDESPNDEDEIVDDESEEEEEN